MVGPARIEGDVAPDLPISLRRVLTAYRRALQERFGDRILVARLFGSYGRGDASPDSDADVCVVVADLTESERTEVIDLAFDAWHSCGAQGPLPAALAWSEVQWRDRLDSERRIAQDIDREGFAL